MYSLLTVKDETQTQRQTATTYDWSTCYTARGEERYELCLSNKGLGYSKYMKGVDRSRLAAEARLLENKWDKEWKAHQANNTLNQMYETLNRLLMHTLTIDDAIDFDSLKVTSTNRVKPTLPSPTKPGLISIKSYEELHNEIKSYKNWEAENYKPPHEKLKATAYQALPNSIVLLIVNASPGLGFLILLVAAFSKKLPAWQAIALFIVGLILPKEFSIFGMCLSAVSLLTFSLLQSYDKSRRAFGLKVDYQDYVDGLKTDLKNDIERIQKENSFVQKEFETAKSNATKLFEEQLAQYERGELQELKALNDPIDAFKVAYLSGNKDSIEEYCQMVLNNSSYPGFFPQAFHLKYSEEDRILLLDYDLPDPDSVPKTKTFKYKKTTGEHTEVLLKDKEFLALYDNIVYQVVLRTLHELFEADTGEHVDAIALNAMVTSLNKAKGTYDKKCIASVFVKKTEFCQINLEYVDPKECFRDLKGVGSSQLASMTPIAPVVRFATEDKRFVDSYSVINDLNESSNLASMNWEDFEHLVRELFEKKWADKGAEVRVTQASRDGGIDAVIFDPDPLTGGKIVVQAKRYTNTVGVSAIRDLFGTVQHEGANKGILVTTAAFGPDAYQFIKGKPLTLISGNELLHLFQEFGYNFRINLKEAKVELGY
jgi:restriction system protein